MVVTKCYKVLRGSSDWAERIAYVIELALLLYSPEVGSRVMLVRSMSISGNRFGSSASSDPITSPQINIYQCDNSTLEGGSENHGCKNTLSWIVNGARSMWL